MKAADILTASIPDHVVIIGLKNVLFAQLQNIVEAHFN